MGNEFVIGIGELLWDIFPGERRLGGAPANFAFHVSQFGLDSVAVTAVGNDEPGDAAVKELEGRSRRQATGEKQPSGSFRTMAARVDFPTGTVVVTLDDAGIPSYDIRMPAAWDNIPLSGELLQLATRTRAVCFGSLARRCPVSRRTITRFIDAVPSGEGRYRIFDINLRQNFYSEDIVAEGLKQCNTLKANDEELDILSTMFSLSGTDQAERCRSIMNRFDIGTMILTCGVQGSYVFSSTSGETSFLRTPKVRVADTVGAGDSFTAAFTAALLHGLSLTEAHRLAVDVSAYICTQKGAMPALPDSLISFPRCRRNTQDTPDTEEAPSGADR